MRNLLIMTGFLLALTPTAAWSFEGNRDTGSSNYWLAEPPRNLAPEEEIASPAEMREAPAAESPAAPSAPPPLSPPPISGIPQVESPMPEPTQSEPESSLALPPALGAPPSVVTPDKGVPDLQLAPTGEEASGGPTPQLPPMP